MAYSGSFTAESLGELPRRDLQALAKQHGVKANGKSSAIIARLVEKASSTPVEQDAAVQEEHKEVQSAEVAPATEAVEDVPPQNTEEVQSSVVGEEACAEIEPATAVTQAESPQPQEDEDGDVQLQPRAKHSPVRQSMSPSVMQAASAMFRAAERANWQAARASAPRRGGCLVRPTPKSTGARLSTPCVPGVAGAHRPTPAASVKPSRGAGSSKGLRRAFDLASSLSRKPSWALKKGAVAAPTCIKAASRENAVQRTASKAAQRVRQAARQYSNRGGRAALGSRSVNTPAQ